MRAKLDENMPAEAAQVLADVGWDVATVHDENMVGAEDSLVAAACRAESRVLFSLDLDFADIRAYPPGDYDGIVVCRLADPDRESVLHLLRAAVPVLAVEQVRHRLWILEFDRMRVRQ
jgi:predicted nuclease of predicted toxin-antitoxin system